MVRERLINGHKKAGKMGVLLRTHVYTLSYMRKSLMVRPIVINHKANVL